ncbi:MAG: dihydrofolate reductase family protein, partial [Planctomycetota bacterium]
DDGPALVTALAGTPPAPLPEHIERLELPSEPCDENRVDLLALLDALAERGVYRLFLEGGGETAGAFLDQGQTDEIRAFLCPKLIGGADARSPYAAKGFALMKDAADFAPLSVEPVGSDLLIAAQASVGEPPGDFWFHAAQRAARQNQSSAPSPRDSDSE